MKSVFRHVRGQVTIEVALLAVLIVIVALLTMDISVLLFGAGNNDRAAREAARAAAQGSSYSAALQLAQAAASSFAADGYFLTTPQVNTSSFVYQDYGGNVPPGGSPYVQVTTTCSARVPAPAFLFGLRIFNGDNAQFTASHAFPIVKTQLYLQ